MRAMNSFRKRMAMILIIFSIAPVLILGVYAYESLSKNRERNFEESFFVALRNDLKSWSLWTDSLRMDLTVASKIHLFNGSKNALVDQRKIIVEGSSLYNELIRSAVVTNRGKYTLRFDPEISGKGLNGGQSNLLFFYWDYDANSKKNYFIKQSIPLSEVTKVLEDTLDNDFSAYTLYIGDTPIFNKGDETLYDPELPYYNREGYAIVNLENKRYMGVYEGNEALGLYVSVYRDFSPALDSIFTYRRRYLMNIALVGILGTATALFFGRKIHYPINKIKEAVEEILNENISKRIEVVEKDEFGVIYEAFNRMAEMETENYYKILNSTETVSERNKSLLEINNQLENSYMMLQEAKDNLTYTESKYVALIDNIEDLIWTMDEKYIINYVNEVVFQKLGFTVEEILGMDIRDLISMIQEETSVESILDQMKYVDVSNVNMYFNKNESDEKEVMVVSTKRIFNGFELEGIQGFARFVSDDWILHHKTLKRNKEMEITSQISWVLANNISLNELLEEIIKKINQLLHPDLCLIGLKEPSNAFNVTSFGGTLKETCGEIKAKFTLKDIERVLSKKQLWIRSETFEEYFKAEEVIIGEMIHEVVIMPLIFDKEVIGYFSVASGKTLTDSDLSVLQIFANQAAIAVDKAKLYQTLKDDYLNTIRVLVTAVEAKDTYTEGHSYRVSKFSKLIAEVLTDDADYIEEIEIAGILHDIGKIGIYDRILTKTGHLTEDEFKEIQKHPEVGSKIVKPIELSPLIVEGILLHHKRYDLKGYPKDLIVQELPLSAGIIGVADALDAITSKRSYSGAMDLDFAVLEILSHAGTQFHPEAIRGLESAYKNQRIMLQNIVKTKI